MRTFDWSASAIVSWVCMLLCVLQSTVVLSVLNTADDFETIILAQKPSGFLDTIPAQEIKFTSANSEMYPLQLHHLSSKRENFILFVETRNHVTPTVF